MPIYEYVCSDCATRFEILVRGDETPACPTCGRSKLAKQFSVPAAHTRGSAPQCPTRGTCPASECCGQNCGMANWMQ